VPARWVRWPHSSRPPRRSVARTLALVAVGAVLVAGCGNGGSDFSTPVGRYLFGTLAGDPGTPCVWIVPGDPGRTSAPVEIRLPSTATVRFLPAVTVSAGGRTFRAGDAVIVEELGRGEGRPGCPLAAQHTTIVAGTPQPWRGIVNLSTPPVPKST
jgi:hypothetical protein